MNREQAESLLAQLVFDDLEDPVRLELLAYLKTDAELSERLGDMRLTAKLLHDAVEAGDAPKLDEQHKAELHKKIEIDKRRGRLMGVLRKPVGSRLTAYSALAAACILIVALLLPSLGAARRSSLQSAATSRTRGIGIGMHAYAQDNDGRYPERVSQLVEGGYITPENLIAPGSDTEIPSNLDLFTPERQSRWIDQNSSFKLLARGKKVDEVDPELVVGYMAHGEGKGISIARGDGSASYGSVDELPVPPPSESVNFTSTLAYVVRSGDDVASRSTPYAESEAEVFNQQQARVDDARRRLAVKDRSAGYAVADQLAVDDGDGWVVFGDAPAAERGYGTSDERLVERGLGERVSGGLSITSASAEGLVYRYDDQTTPGRGRSVGQAGVDTVGKGVAMQAESGSESRQLQEFYAKQAEAGERFGYGNAMGSSGGGMGGYDLGTGGYGGGMAGGTSLIYDQADDRLGVIALNESTDQSEPGEATDWHLGREATSLRRGVARNFVSDLEPVPESSASPATAPMAQAPAATDSPEFARNEALIRIRKTRETVLYLDDLHSPDSVEFDSVKQALTSAGQGRTPQVERLEGVAASPVGVDQLAQHLEVDSEDLDAVALGVVAEAADKKEREADEEAPVLVGNFVIPAPEELKPARKPRLMPVNPWVMTGEDRLSTFALDVDTASYGIARRYIRDGFLPPRHTVRMEEFVNNFDYNYPTGQGGSEVFTVHAEAGASPFNAGTVLLKVGVRGKVVGRDQAKPAHLVFVIDTSGSMDRDDRLPLVRQSVAMVLDQLSDNDRVTVVGYGTEARLLVESAPGGEKMRILDAVEALQIGGSTNLLGGVALGYEVAQRHYITGGVNRVILCSDGVANVGPSEADDLLGQAQSLRKQGVTFTSVGFGAGNYDDRILEQIANKGDGGYLFVGSLDEAKRVFIDDLAATRPTIAFDAKIQVDFDPARVRRYRLIGYENRDIADTDFRNDTVDAGEVGSGQSATALYELELIGPALTTGDEPDLGTVYVRYRDADTGRVREIESRLTNDRIARCDPASAPRFYVAASAARFAEVLRGSEHLSDPDVSRNLLQVQNVLEPAAAQLPMDRSAQELVELVRRSQGLPRAE
jgi:Ca-activated chloride channel homolog